MIDNLQHLVTNYGYIAVFLGCVFEGEVTLLIAMVAVGQGLLGFPAVIVTALVGTIAGDNFWFQAGRHMGRPLVARRARWRLRARYVNHQLERYGRGFVIGTRFFYGLRSVTPFVMGAAHYPPIKFFVYDLIGAALWLAVLTAVIFTLGSAISHLIELLGTGYGTLAMMAIGLILFAVAAALFIWHKRVDRSINREEAEAADTETSRE